MLAAAGGVAAKGSAIFDNSTLEQRCAMKLRPAKPSSSMAHVDGSGTAGTLKIEILGLAGSFAAGLIHCCTAFEPDISSSVRFEYIKSAIRKRLVLVPERGCQRSRRCSNLPACE